MLTTTDTLPRHHPDDSQVEHELTELEGLAIALKIVRFGDGVLSNLNHRHPAYVHALYTLVDSVVTQVEELSKAYRGESLGGDEDEDEDDKPIWAKNPTVPGQLMELLGSVTDKEPRGA